MADVVARSFIPGKNPTPADTAGPSKRKHSSKTQDDTEHDRDIGVTLRDLVDRQTTMDARQVRMEEHQTQMDARLVRIEEQQSQIVSMLQAHFGPPSDGGGGSGGCA